MENAAFAVAEQARKLSPSARLEVVDAILATLDEPNRSMDRLWSQEAEERLAAYRRGEVKAIPLNEVLAKHLVTQ